jgi:DNA polymerase-1
MLGSFSEVWGVDFEFESPNGGTPQPVCMVARELRSRRGIRLFRDDLRSRSTAPYSIGPDSLFVAYYAPAELGCHLALGWPLPVNVLDLYAEFRNLGNGTKPELGFGLLGALHHFGLDPMPAVAKDAMRSLALRGGSWTVDEQEALLGYCQKDADAVVALLNRMGTSIDLPRALLRGRFTKAIARMECLGVPLDGRTLTDLRNNWSGIQDKLVREADNEFGVFEGRHFRQELFRGWLERNRIVWPTFECGSLMLDKGTFKAMAMRYPQVEPLRELRNLLSQLRDLKLEMGTDDRSRTLLSPFASKTGRNQPSTTRFIFGLSQWSRFLIRPRPGYSLAYVDWEQQEFGIAAGLSGDVAMLDAYQSGDPYLTFAKQAGAAPPDATTDSHADVREVYKQCALAVQYCMGAKSFALRIGATEERARGLLDLHRKTFRKFWSWSDSAVQYAFLQGEIHSAFGWRMTVTRDTSERTVRNFPMQANGAEMMRLACCFATERGVRVCCPVHDAFLIEAPSHQIEAAIATTQSAMAEASSLVLNGFILRTESKSFGHAEHFPVKKRSEALWKILMRHLGEHGNSERAGDLFNGTEVGPSCEQVPRELKGGVHV